MSNSNSVVLFTIEGLPARILRVVFGTAILAVGVFLVAVEAGDTAGREALFVTGLGGVFALVGLYSYVQAVRTDTLRITVGDRRGRHDV